MRVAIRVSADAEPWDEMVIYVQEAERLATLGRALELVEEVNHEQRG